MAQKIDSVKLTIDRIHLQKVSLKKMRRKRKYLEKWTKNCH